MIIKFLRVQNFKCFEDKSFEFGEGFNLIIGDNGTGKTAVLEAIGTSVSIFLRALGLLSGKPKRNFVRVGTHIQGEITLLQELFPVTLGLNIFAFQENLQQIQAIYDNSESRDISRLRDSFLPNTFESGSSSMVTSHHLPEKLVTATYGNIYEFGVKLQKDVQRSETSIILPLIAKYSTARLWLEKPEPDDQLTQPLLFDEEVIKPGSRLDGYKNALDVAISNKSWLKWFMRMELISLQEKKPLKTFEAVKEAVQTCLEDCDLLYFDVKRGEPVARIQGDLLPFSLLSDGQRSMLAMVADIAYRMAQLNPHLVENVALETPGVVLIDELDLHLHPKWQGKVIENLRRAFPKVQFFATSHSPFVIQSLRQHDRERPDKLIDLNESPTSLEYQDKSIEDIAEMVQGVEMPQRSRRELEMLEAAKAYYHVLEQAKATEGAELQQLKDKLDELSKPYAEDIAYIAFLEAKRESALKERA